MYILSIYIIQANYYLELESIDQHISNQWQIKWIKTVEQQNYPAYMNTLQLLDANIICSKGPIS